MIPHAPQWRDHPKEYHRPSWLLRLIPPPWPHVSSVITPKNITGLPLYPPHAPAPHPVAWSPQRRSHPSCRYLHIANNSQFTPSESGATPSSSSAAMAAAKWGDRFPVPPSPPPLSKSPSLPLSIPLPLTLSFNLSLLPSPTLPPSLSFSRGGRRRELFLRVVCAAEGMKFYKRTVLREWHGYWEDGNSRRWIEKNN